MTWIDHVPPPIKAQRSKAFAKKSRSTTSCPLGVQLRHFRVPVGDGFESLVVGTPYQLLDGLTLPLRDQIGMQLMPLRQFRHRSMAPYGLKRDLGLELGRKRLRVFMSDGPSRRWTHFSSLSGTGASSAATRDFAIDTCRQRSREYPLLPFRRRSWAVWPRAFLRPCPAPKPRDRRDARARGARGSLRRPLQRDRR
jgi:hypothetical protein